VKMNEMLASLLNMLMPISPLLTPSLLTGFAAYAIWYFAFAKRPVPLTPNEAQLLWKIHKQNTKCGAKKWRELKRGDVIIGFECECGYKHVQKRPII